MLTSYARHPGLLLCLLLTGAPAFALGGCVDSPENSTLILALLGALAAAMPSLWNSLRKSGWNNARRLPARTLAYLAVMLASTLVLSACGGSSSGGSATPVSTGLHGTVHGGRQPVTGSVVLVYEAGLNPGDAPTQIGNASTAGDGTWTIATFSPTPTNGQLIYVYAMGGDASPGTTNANASFLTVAGVWGSASFPNSVNLDELTTVASTAQLQNYITEVDCSTISNTSISTTGNTCPSISGATNLNSRAATIANLVNATNGTASNFLTSAAGGSAINATLRNLNFEASILASCINSAGGVAGDSSACGNLFALLPVDGGVLTPGGTLGAGSSAYYVTVTPNNEYAYVSDNNTNTVSGFSIDSSSGALTPLPGSPFVVGSNPGVISVSPNGQYAYVTNENASTVSAFSIDETDPPASGGGTLTPITGSPFATGNDPYTVTISPNGAYAYVTNNGDSTISAFSIDETDPVGSGGGVLTPVSGSPFTGGSGTYAVTVSPNSAYAYVTNINASTISAFSIDETDPPASGGGALTPLATASYATGGAPAFLSVSPNGAYLYVASISGNNVSAYSIDETDPPASGGGTLTPLAGSPYAAAGLAYGMAVSPDGAFVYTSILGGGIQAYSVNSSTGVLSTVAGTYPTGNQPTGLALSPNGQFAYAANQNDGTISAYTINNNTTTDTVTAALTLAQRAGNSSVVSGLFALSPLPAVYQPIPGAAPASWSIGGQQFAFVASQGVGIDIAAFNPLTGAITTAGSVSDSNNPSGITVAPNGTYAYVTDSNSLVVYSIDPGTGTLTQVNSVVNNNEPDGIAISPDGAFAYVAEYHNTTTNSSDIATYSIDPVTGWLTPVGTPVADPGAPYAVAISPNGAYLYAADNTNDISVYSVSSGVLTAVPALTVADTNGPDGIAISPDGNHAVVAEYGGSSGSGTSGVSTFTLDPVSGALTLVGTGSDSNSPYGIAFSPDGSFVVTADNAGDIASYSLNLSTGALTQASILPGLSGIYAVAVSP